MAERAHPKHFNWFRKSRLFGIIPFISFNPYRKALFWRYKIANKYCDGKIVLDVPCGMGWGTSLLKRARHITGVDISKEAIIEAKKLYPVVASFQVGSMDLLDFKNKSFDVVVCLEGIEHVSEQVGDKFLNECKRVLKNGGLLILSSPYPVKGSHSGNPYHIKEYTVEEIEEKLTSANFKILSKESRQVSEIIITIFISQLS
jgi:2-polyprenyl-3-methyl-5-hydroxy-6-metoxy-1,4-benzoquinol methylase